MAHVYTVSTVSELYTALASSTGGETIRMAGGDYGSLNLKYQHLNYATPITIVSDDPNNPAIISEMTLNGAKNMTFEDITFKSYHATGAIWYEPFVVRNSENISFENALFEGTPAQGVSEAEDGTGRGKGLFVENSKDIAVTDSEFSMWYRGMLFSEVENLTVTGNDVHSIRSDGMNFSAIRTAFIEDNYIHDFKTVASSGDHADMMQIMNLGNTTSSDMIIRGNTFDIGEGSTVQTLFMRNQIVDQTGAGIDSYYQNITIEENVILNGHAHGITVGETNNLIVRNNTVLSINTDDPEFSSSPYITVAGDSRNVVIDRNVSESVSGYTGQADWQVDGNILVQNHDPQKEGFYENEFITSTLEDDSVENITVRTDGTIAQNDAGAERLLPGQSDNDVEPLFNLSSVLYTPQKIVFDASETHGLSASALPEGTEFHWDFGDGSTGTGISVQHTYASAGIYTASLRVVLENGESYTETTNVEVAGSAVLSMDAATGNFQQHHYGESSDVANSRIFVEAADGGGKALVIGNTTSASSVPKEVLARFFGTDTFEMSMTLKADAAGVSHGEVARIHDSFLLSTDIDGNLKLILFLDTGAIGVTTAGVELNDGNSHDISIFFDGKSELLTIDVDGQEAASVDAIGNMKGMTYYDLTFGNSWGKQTFEGQISDFVLDVEAYDYPLVEGALPVLISSSEDFKNGLDQVETIDEPVDVLPDETPLPEDVVSTPVTPDDIDLEPQNPMPEDLVPGPLAQASMEPEPQDLWYEDVTDWAYDEVSNGYDGLYDPEGSFVDTAGNVNGIVYWDLTCGNFWGKQTFENQIDNFDLGFEAYDNQLIEAVLPVSSSLPSEVKNALDQVEISDEFFDPLPGEAQVADGIEAIPLTSSSVDVELQNLWHNDVTEWADDEVSSEHDGVGAQEVASVDTAGNIEGSDYWVRTFGNPSDNQTFEGQIDNFDLDVEAYDNPLIEDALPVSPIPSEEVKNAMDQLERYSEFFDPLPGETQFSDEFGSVPFTPASTDMELQELWYDDITDWSYDEVSNGYDGFVSPMLMDGTFMG